MYQVTGEPSTSATTDNSTSELNDQILNGLRQKDLNALYGEGRIGQGTHIDSAEPIWMQGDTGLSSGLKSSVQAVHGKKKLIPIYDQLGAKSVGNNTEYHVVGWGVVTVISSEWQGQTNTRVIVEKSHAFMGKLRPKGTLSATSGYVDGALHLTRACRMSELDAFLVLLVLFRRLPGPPARRGTEIPAAVSSRPPLLSRQVHCCAYLGFRQISPPGTRQLRRKYWQLINGDAGQQSTVLKHLIGDSPADSSGHDGRRLIGVPKLSDPPISEPIRRSSDAGRLPLVVTQQRTPRRSLASVSEIGASTSFGTPGGGRLSRSQKQSES